MNDVLFCTDTLWERRATEIRAIDPNIEVVRLVGAERVADSDIERITVAFFSGDAWPERTPNFMQVCLQAAGLQWFHTMSAGVDHPVFRGFVDRGVTLTTSSGSSASPIAQTVLMYLLALSRDLPGWMRAQAEHRWEPHTIHELDDRTVAVVGMGPIGAEVARLTAALGMRPIGVRRTIRGDEPCETRTFADLDEVLAQADAVVLAVPLTDDTRELVDRRRLAALRPGALFVNVGRGELVDEVALADLLADGHLGGAGLDVFATEPLPTESPLWDLPNVIVTPHSSGVSAGTDRRAEEIFLDNLARRRSGEPLRNAVT